MKKQEAVWSSADVFWCLNTLSLIVLLYSRCITFCGCKIPPQIALDLFTITRLKANFPSNCRDEITLWHFVMSAISLCCRNACLMSRPVLILSNTDTFAKAHCDFISNTQMTFVAQDLRWRHLQRLKCLIRTCFFFYEKYRLKRRMLDGNKVNSVIAYVKWCVNYEFSLTWMLRNSMAVMFVITVPKWKGISNHLREATPAAHQSGRLYKAISKLSEVHCSTERMIMSITAMI